MITEKSKVPAIDRLMAIIDFLMKNGPSKMRDIIAATKISRSSAYTLVAELEHHGIVKQRRDGCTMLWLKAIAVGNAALRSLDIIPAVRPHLEKLVHDTGSLSAYFGVISDGEASFVCEATNPGVLVCTKSRAGQPIDLVHSGNGKCLLAHLNEKTIDAVLPTLNYTPITATSIKDAKALGTELIKIRQQGYAYNNSEDDPEIRSVAVPVFYADQSLAGSISLVATVRHFDEIGTEHMVGAVKACAVTIERQLLL